MSKIIENLFLCLNDKIARFTPLEKRIFKEWLMEHLGLKSRSNIYNYLEKPCAELETSTMIELATFLGYEFTEFVETVEIVPKADSPLQQKVNESFIHTPKV